jgi:cytochrome P450
VPTLIRFDIKPSCRRYKRNVLSFRSAIQDIIDERRRQGNPNSESDILSILTSLDIYDDERTKDELTILFIAGNETLRISSANTVCYLYQNPEMKAKFLAEIVPVLDEVSNDLVNGLTME